jgi:hypothetical protein
MVSPVAAPAEGYDFSFFFGSSENPITIERIVSRYAAEKNVRVWPITTGDDAAGERYLRIFMRSSDPPAGYAISEESKDSFATTSGIGWRFHGRGFVCDRRVLSDLIGAGGADAPETYAFAENLGKSSFSEWRWFLKKLKDYIAGAQTDAFMLNGNEYKFAAEKGKYSSRLNGIFALSGVDPSFLGSELMRLSAVTSDGASHSPEADSDYGSDSGAGTDSGFGSDSGSDADSGFGSDSGSDEDSGFGSDSVSGSGESTTSRAISAYAPVLRAYVSALDTYTRDIAGLYAPGIRGDDFINEKIYSAEYTRSAFYENRALFMPFDSDIYEELKSENATQSEHFAMIPVKIPYGENGLSAFRGVVAANAALSVETKYSLCANEGAPPKERRMAEDFIKWLAEDKEFSDTIQLSMAAYYAEGAVIPLKPDDDEESGYGTGGVFAAENIEGTLSEDDFGIYVKPLLSYAEWDAAKTGALIEGIAMMWYPASGRTGDG